MWISGLYHTACVLAVYASQYRVAPVLRKTRFRLLACFAGRGWLPARFQYKVSEITTSFPLSRLCLAQNSVPYYSGRVIIRLHIITKCNKINPYFSTLVRI